ncbi:toxin-antitoxin system YwqK family antitoxin [Ramlibacter sp.]|uniref:toxin-antitoxin system YwqK family antitoxin n=1 Tax=Ramlibacter sp. TaxID=1917967 RepID=UPI003D0E1C9D
MTTTMADPDVAETFYHTGEVRFRYGRVMAADGTRWIRSGDFREYDRRGQLLSEGSYENGREHGLWREYYNTGQLAAEGHYVEGKPSGAWRYWKPDGTPGENTVQRVGQPRKR